MTVTRREIEVKQTRAWARGAEVNQMSNPSKNSKVNVPEAKDALNNMKYEVARELGVNMKQGYNGDLTSRENGYVGGYMVKKMIEDYERQMSGSVQ